MGALRELTITQQVGLLFVAFFGVLTLATLFAVYGSLRELSPAQQALHERFKRDLGATWFGAVLFWTVSYTMSRESQRLERKLGVGTR